MVALFEKLVYQGVMLIFDPRSKIPMFLSFLSKRAPTIRVRTFIALDKIPDTSEGKGRMFITLYGPSKVGEVILVIIECNTLVEVVPGISCPVGIPPKPPNVVIVSIILARGDHC